ncbi:unnamed protein product [Angiostrongylus costaricensis]|uniref:Transcriptional regulator n=1 Tax=Angiostrongylus costaricensis TaxID=334426 RepID=A0A0R3PRR3_ANGCS|nr:unnamed protein product [Angiostrongylus costaricensis]
MPGRCSIPKSAGMLDGRLFRLINIILLSKAFSQIDAVWTEDDEAQRIAMVGPYCLQLTVNDYIGKIG